MHRPAFLVNRLTAELGCLDFSPFQPQPQEFFPADGFVTFQAQLPVLLLNLADLLPSILDRLRLPRGAAPRLARRQAGNHQLFNIANNLVHVGAVYAPLSSHVALIVTALKGPIEFKLFLC